MIPALRKMKRQTEISGMNVTIAMPAGYEKSLFEEVTGKVESYAGSMSILENPGEECLTKATGPVILIGNLSNSLCVERLYYDFLSATDLWYPGPSGYEVRTLIDPYGTGFNIIHIGYSDKNGLKRALGYFVGIVDRNILHQAEIRPERLHIPDEYANHIFNDELDSTKDTYFYSIRPENKGYLAYLTGNAEVLREYSEAFLSIMEMPLHHLMIYNRFVVWRLLEVTGMIEGDILEKGPDYFLRWVKSEEGIGAIDRHYYQSPYIARNNHGTIPALGIKMFSLYLKRYHPEISEADEFEQLADNVYKPYFDGSWKPQCDGLCHGWWLSQPVLFHYGLLDPEKKYFKSEGARRAAECAIAVINNSGYLPPSGDASMNRQHPGFVLRIAAAYYKDGRYRYANDMLPFEYANTGEFSALARQFDIGIEPVEPNAGGVAVVPLDKLIYGTWQYEDEEYASMVSDTAPSGPIEKCYDKISFRAGWDKNDDFLLVDGIGGGGHSYADAGSILEYSVHGIPFLVSHDSLTFVEPEEHNMVTISRNGERKPITAFPMLEEMRDYEDGTGYIRILSQDNNGADWTREIYFVPGVGIGLRDHIEAVEDGEFSIEDHFRTPGPVLPRENGYVSIKNSREGKKIAFVLTSFDDDASITFEKKSYNHLFRTPPGREKPEFIGLDNRALFLERNRIMNPEITAYRAKYNKKLVKGDSVVFSHFISISAEGQKPAEANMTEDGIVVVYGNTKKALAFNKRAPEKMIDFDPEQPEFDFFADLLNEEASEILSVDMKDGIVVRGLMSGDVSGGPSDGETSWEIKGDVPVHTVCLEGNMMFTGSGSNRISAYENGILVWQRLFERIPTMYFWWELETQRVVSMKFSKGKLFAGCGDNHLRCYSADGEELWAYYYRASVPAGFEIYDIDSDGKEEIIIYGGALGAYSQIEIIDMEGKLKYRPNEPIGAGWTSRTSSIKVFEWSGSRYILQGVNRKKNLVLYRFDGNGNGFTEVFSHYLAGAVTALYFENGIIYTGTSLGFVSAYDMEGHKLWLSSLGGGVRYISGTRDGLIVIENGGTMYRLDKKGDVLVLSMDSMIPSNILEDKEGLFLVQDRGIYRVRREPTEYDL